MFKFKILLRRISVFIFILTILSNAGPVFARSAYAPETVSCHPRGFKHRPLLNKSLHRRRFYRNPAGFLSSFFKALRYKYPTRHTYSPGKTTVFVLPEVHSNIILYPELSTARTSWNTLTINILNSTSSYTQVILTQYGNGYLGPQGEYYPEMPSVQQLRTLYTR